MKVSDIMALDQRAIKTILYIPDCKKARIFLISFVQVLTVNFPSVRACQNGNSLLEPIETQSKRG